MKLLKLSLFVALVFAFTACDDSEKCVQSDWVGTYTGTENCDGTSSDVDITITASGSDAIVIEYSYDSTGTVTYDPITFEDCGLSQTATQGGVTLTTTASINGDQLSITEVLSGTATSNCTITATRN